ncbi:TPR repeat-containing protein [Synechococcus sp. BIOS-U3-1]|uniref:tetratricopeptide repeat protein n=1 Tax=Synechococcus sp. BIOS-U3-1 TaxID=1400865 RepID=UPI001644534E|nr:tetratricopeptide repeat protein [Synechococcus sp. BIOS-U3-1]QNI57108.1 TPR repeat-containing protein [Synechococcus sp. BIOS-U3-1]
MAGFKKSAKNLRSKQRPKESQTEEIISKALTAYQEGDLQKAKKLAKNGLRLDQENSFLLGILATIEKALGNHKRASQLFEVSINISQEHPDILHNYSGLLQEKDLQKAINLSKKAIAMKPNNSNYLERIGHLLWKAGELENALEATTKAIALKANNPNSYLNLGNIHKDIGNLDQALSSTLKSLELKPDNPEAHMNLGSIYQELGNLDHALASTLKSLELKPDNSGAHMNLGAIYQDKGNLDKALSSTLKSLELKPDSSEAHINLGAIYQDLGNVDKAIEIYKISIQIRSDCPETNKNLSMAELLKGDYKNGWLRYEYRFCCKKDNGILSAAPSCEMWSGEALSKGEQLLLVSEQGLGDTLQFMRYVTVLRNQGIPTSICAQPKLHDLIKISGIDTDPLTPQQANKLTQGKWLPLLSIPKHLEVSPENPIATEPYIKTSDELILKWAELLSSEKRPIIGINWQGNPDHEKTSSMGRSIPLTSFSTIARETNSTLLSLQKGYGSEQLDTCSFKDHFVNCQEEVSETWDFLSTAAIISNCDLIITSDTSIAHLAGGMGKNTWLLLKKVPEWRWGLEGDTTFWYPSMRLFRQSKHGDWDKVLERVAKAIKFHF